jgi:hypothetical protein
VPVDGTTLEFNRQGELTLKMSPEGGQTAIAAINTASGGTIAPARLPGELLDPDRQLEPMEHGLLGPNEVGRRGGRRRNGVGAERCAHGTRPRFAGDAGG